MKTSQKFDNDIIKPSKLNTPILLVFLFFLFVNFLGLYLGSLFTTSGVASEWYATVNKSPITPPGWFFGFAWTTIMVCLAFYMTIAFNYSSTNKQKLYTVYGIQWILNFAWNPLFFTLHYVEIGLITIVTLATIVSYILFTFLKSMRWKSVLIMPYFLWIYVACYLNLYILLNN